MIGIKTRSNHAHGLVIFS